MLFVALINFTKSFNNIDFVPTSKLEETNLFLSEVDSNVASLPNILLTAMKEYTGHPNQIQALVNLEQRINPYILTEFMNTFATEPTKPSIPVQKSTDYELSYGDFDR